MNKIEFIRQNGNIPKVLPGKDHISGFIAYLADPIPGSFDKQPIQICSSIERAEALGITSSDTTGWEVRNLHYQLSQIYRLNPGLTLYIGLYEHGATPTFAEVKKMQTYASGDIRQIGIWDGGTALADGNITALQGVATALEAADMPLSILYAPQVTAIAGLPKDIAVSGQKNVSVIIGQDCGGIAADLHNSELRKTRSVTGIGIALGLVSKAKVHQSISWVGQYPTGVSLPGFADGSVYQEQDSGVIEALDNARYIFYRTYPDYAGAYVNDSYTLDTATSDYDTIEAVRTMDKAVRGIRTYLLPELGGELEIDPDTGQLHPATVKHLETVANQQLDDMQQAGELSGFEVTIDPGQDVLSTNTIEFVASNVPKGVFRNGRVKIGYAKSIND